MMKASIAATAVATTAVAALSLTGLSAAPAFASSHPAPPAGSVTIGHNGWPRGESATVTIDGPWKGVVDITVTSRRPERVEISSEVTQGRSVRPVYGPKVTERTPYRVFAGRVSVPSGRQLKELVIAQALSSHSTRPDIQVIAIRQHIVKG